MVRLAVALAPLDLAAVKGGHRSAGGAGVPVSNTLELCVAARVLPFYEEPIWNVQSTKIYISGRVHSRSPGEI